MPVLEGKIPGIFDDPGASRRDILSEQRERGPRKLWWPGNWLSGRAGIVAVVGFIVLGLGWIVVDGGVGLGEPGSNLEPPPVEYVHPEAGRGLTGPEYALAEPFGEPLLLGKGGVPLVRHRSTGLVRPLTPVEVDYSVVNAGLDRPYLETGVDGVVWTTGPRGWGIWWKENSALSAIGPLVSFPRERWRSKQEAELELALAGVTEALRGLGAVDFTVWRSGGSQGFYAVARYLRGVHPVVADHGLWWAVPHQWSCDLGLERALNAGVTQGCPPVEYQVALEESWSRLGVVVDLVYGMGRLGMVMDSMSTGDLYDSGLVADQAYAAADLLDEVRRLEGALEVLRHVSAQQGLIIDVGLFRGA